MDDERICRICFDDESSGVLIQPCGCKGTSAFVHKECLNSWLSIHKNDKKYFQCSECKKEYKREKSSGQDSAVEFEMGTYALALTVGSMVLLVMAIFICGVSPLICSIILFVLFLISLCATMINDFPYLIWILFIFYITTSYSARKVKTFIVDLWLVGLYIALFFDYLEYGWNSTKQIIISNYLGRFKPKMYDYHTKSYVAGII